MSARTTQDALAAIAGVCDGASTWDGAGFSGVDTEFGHKLARSGLSEGWTEKQHAAAVKLCHKYRKQLASHGFDIVALTGENYQAEGLRRREAKAAPAAPQAAPGYARPTKPIDGFPNRYAGRCGCGTRVEAGHGRCTKQDGRWAIYCAECSEPTREADRAEQTERARTAVEALLLSEAIDAGEADPWVLLRVVGPNGEALPS